MVTSKDMKLPLKKKKYSENCMQGFILEEISRKKMYCCYCLTFMILKSVAFKRMKFNGINVELGENVVQTKRASNATVSNILQAQDIFLFPLCTSEI